MTCKHAEDVFLDPAVQTPVSTFITASELRTEVFKLIVGAGLVIVFDSIWRGRYRRESGCRFRWA